MSRPKVSSLLAACLATLLGLVALPALAQADVARAWLDRDRVELGEAVTLNVESYRRGGDPDFSVLQADFVLRGSSSSTETAISGRQTRTRQLWAVVLEPRREGVIGIPSLAVGDEQTAPITLTVLPPRQGTGADGEAAFIETQIDDERPYVGQAVVLMVRLLYRVTLLEAQLDVPEPDGAAIRRLGDDQSSYRMINGIRYNLVERRYLLVPEHSGELTVPPVRFRGRGLVGRGLRADQALGAMGQAHLLQVRPRPVPAGQAWLPAHRLSLELVDLPDEARAGEPFTLTLRLEADGLSSEQVPDITLPAIPGAQVYPEPAQFTERVRDGRPSLAWSRRFAIVAPEPGSLSVPGLQLDWWSLPGDAPERAELGPRTIEVRAASALSTAPLGTGADATQLADQPVPPLLQPAAVEPAAAASTAWRSASVLLALGWLLTLGWIALDRRRRAGAPTVAADARPAAHPGGDGRALRRALASHDTEAINAALLALSPDGRSLDALASALSDPEQAAAIRDLQAARWGRGDPARARERLGRAFAGGPAWRAIDGTGEVGLLPPLYPRSRNG